MHHSSPVGYLDVCLIQVVEAVDGNGVGKGGLYGLDVFKSCPVMVQAQQSESNVAFLGKPGVCSLPLTRQYERVSPFSMK